MAARNHIDLVAKTLRTLEVLGEREEGVALAELARRTQLVKSSVFRILFTLRELGYVEQVNGGGVYAPTLKLMHLARNPARRVNLVSVARPHLMALRDVVGESAWLAELRSGEVVLVDSAETPHPLRLSLGVGDRCPLHATALGKAVAAHLPPAEAEGGRLRRLTLRTNTDLERYRAELERVRKVGYAVNNEETVAGAVLFGAPIFDSRGRVFAAVSAGAPTVRCMPEKRRMILDAVKQTARALNEELARLGFEAA